MIDQEYARRCAILQYAAQCRVGLINTYQAGGTEFGREAARALVREVGAVLEQFHGPEIAAGALWDVADAIATNEPVAPLKTLPQVSPKPGVGFKAKWVWDTGRVHSFLTGATVATLGILIMVGLSIAAERFL